MRLPPLLLRIFQRKYALLILFLPLAVFSVLFFQSLTKDSENDNQGESPNDSSLSPSVVTESSEPPRSPQERELDALYDEKGSSIEMTDASSDLDRLRGTESSRRDALQESSALDSIRSSASPDEGLDATSF